MPQYPRPVAPEPFVPDLPLRQFSPRGEVFQKGIPAFPPGGQPVAPFLSHPPSTLMDENIDTLSRPPDSPTRGLQGAQMLGPEAEENKWEGYQLGPEYMRLLNLMGPEMYPSPDLMPDMFNMPQAMGALPLPPNPLMYFGPENMAMTHPDVMRGRNFMAPWNGPEGSMDSLYGMPRLYTEDMWDIAPKDI